MKLSPDGKKIAVGLEVNGKTYIHDIKSGSVLWSVRIYLKVVN